MRMREYIRKITSIFLVFVMLTMSMPLEVIKNSFSGSFISNAATATQMTQNITTKEREKVFVTTEVAQEYKATGEVQEFVAPYTGTYIFECWGSASWKDGYTKDGIRHESASGNGAYVKASYHLEAGQILYIYVGSGTASGWREDNYIPYSFNGGGGTAKINGIVQADQDDASHKSDENKWAQPTGGGATDIRTARASDSGDWESTLSSRILVAAGGGAGGWNGDTDKSLGRGEPIDGSGEPQSNGIIGYGSQYTNDYGYGGGGGGYYRRYSRKSWNQLYQ